MTKETFMRAALDEARMAYEADEVPVGAVIVMGGRIIAAAHNLSRGSANPTRHAELIAIDKACRFINNERLIGCDLYVTKEPCPMCAGAIVNARISRVFIATRDHRFGGCGTILSVCGNSALNHVPDMEFGLMEKEAAVMLKEFFKDKRTYKKG